MELVLIAIIAILLLITLTMFMRGKNRFSKFEYYSRGKEVGFSFAEANRLLAMAKRCNISDPTLVFWGIRELDTIIKGFSDKFKNSGQHTTRENIKFIEKLYNFRKQLEFDQPRYKIGIKSSHGIKINQRLRILVPNAGVYSSTVIDTTAKCLVVSYPVGATIPQGFQWKGVKVSVYFWRNEDAGYVFDTSVFGDLRVRGIPVLELGHSDQLIRTQKRKSVRVNSKLPAWLYLPSRVETSYEKPERVPGLKCIIQDLSEDGLSVLIGGKAKTEIRVKVQFFLGDIQIVMSGIVKAAEYDSKKNQALLHIESVKPSPHTRNIIRAYVYNINANQDIFNA